MATSNSEETHKQTQAILSSLLVLVRETQRSYARATEVAQSSYLKYLFQKYELQCSQLVLELESILADTSLENTKSMKERKATNLVSLFLFFFDQTLVQELLELNNHSKKYLQALNQLPLPETYKPLVEIQSTHLNQAISSLKKVANKSEKQTLKTSRAHT